MGAGKEVPVDETGRRSPWSLETVGGGSPSSPGRPSPSGDGRGLERALLRPPPPPQLPAEGGTGLELGCGRRAGGSLGTSTRDDQGHSGADVAGPSVRQSRRDARGQPGLGHPSRLCPHEGPTAVWQGCPSSGSSSLDPLTRRQPHLLGWDNPRCLQTLPVVPGRRGQDRPRVKNR